MTNILQEHRLIKYFAAYIDLLFIYNNDEDYRWSIFPAQGSLELVAFKVRDLKEICGMHLSFTLVNIWNEVPEWVVKQGLNTMFYGEEQLGGIGNSAGKCN